MQASFPYTNSSEQNRPRYHIPAMVSGTVVYHMVQFYICKCIPPQGFRVTTDPADPLLPVTLHHPSLHLGCCGHLATVAWFKGQRPGAIVEKKCCPWPNMICSLFLLSSLFVNKISAVRPRVASEKNEEIMPQEYT